MTLADKRDGERKLEHSKLRSKNFPNALNVLEFASKIVNGINFVALDNSYYNFDKEQFCFLREQVAKGLPIILLLHNPLYEKD